MIYLVGGAPRVGKTQLAKEVVKQHPMHAISSDAIRSMLRNTIPPEALPPELVRYDSRGKLPSEILKRQNDESRALWPYLEMIMKSYYNDNYDLLVEGVAIIPELCHQLEYPHRAIILSNDDESHATKLQEIADLNASDWMHLLPGKRRQRFVTFFAAMDEWLQDECQKTGIKLAKMHDDTFASDTVKAARQLLES